MTNPASLPSEGMFRIAVYETAWGDPGEIRILTLDRSALGRIILRDESFGPDTAITYRNGWYFDELYNWQLEQTLLPAWVIPQSTAGTRAEYKWYSELIAKTITQFEEHRKMLYNISTEIYDDVDLGEKLSLRWMLCDVHYSEALHDAVESGLRAKYPDLAYVLPVRGYSWMEEKMYQKRDD